MAVEKEPKKRRTKLDKRQTMVKGALPGEAALKWTPTAVPRPTLGELVSIVASDPALLAGVRVRDLDPDPARFAAPREPMHHRLRDKLLERGLSHLYTHQAQAYDSSMQGRDVAVVTGTASGKTLCYNLPVLQTCLTEPLVNALYLYPTKALAHDQLSKLEALLPGPDVRAGVYDGDTARATRALIRHGANLILTNPDMLHLAILPFHETWIRFLKSLRYVVIDEMHVYRGIFGSHVGCVLRRLFRICESYGARPKIVACSATVANPTDLFTRLTGRPPTIVDDDGAPRGRRTLVLIGSNPEEPASDVDPDRPFGDDPFPGRRVSNNEWSARLLVRLVNRDARTMVFCRARSTTELVLRAARTMLRAEKKSTGQIESYRSGYTPKERREIEKGLFGGKLKGLVTTSAMELGVDVGDLDAVVLNGYPGSLSSFWQQVGRAGRGGREALGVMLAHDDPLEQYLVRRPELLLMTDLEAATLNPSNPAILAQHIVCAAYERPIGPSELDLLGDAHGEIAESLEREGRISFSAGRFFYPSHQSPASSVAIRGLSGDSVSLKVAGEVIGTMEAWRATAEAHPGAVYLHRDKTYVVTKLDLVDKEATLEDDPDPEYFTQPLFASSVDPKAELLHGVDGTSLVAVEASLLVKGYRRVSMETGELLDTVVLDLPPTSFGTVAVRLDLPPWLVAEDPDAATPTIHALEHALLSVAPLIAGCDRNDLGSAWYVMYLDTLAPCLFVFDRAPGGVGLSERLFAERRRWFEAARDLLTSCPCEDGCPSCLLLPRCEVSNQMLDKASALALLDELLA